MKHAAHILLLCLVAAGSAQPAFAGTHPALAQPGKPLFEDDFSRPEMAPKWKVGKGFFTIADGVVSVAENPDDHHPAYAYIKPNFPFKDIIVEYSARLVGAKGCNLMINDTAYKDSHAGHILRAGISPGHVSLADLKNGSMKLDIFNKMKDANTTADEKKELQASIKDKQATFKVEEDAGEWHKVRVEIVGPEILISLDGSPAGYLKSDGIDHPTKNAIGFEVSGKSCELKNVQAWEATADPGWAAHRDAVVSSLEQ